MFSTLGPTICKTATACKRVSKTVGLFHAITEIPEYFVENLEIVCKDSS